MLQTIIDTIPHFIFVKDTESRYILANKHLADAVGLKPEQMVGMLSWHLPGAKLDTVESAMAEDRQVLTSGKPVVTEPEPFSVVDRILFRSLPYAEDGRLVSLGMVAPIASEEFLLAYDFLDWRDRQTPFR